MSSKKSTKILEFLQHHAKKGTHFTIGELTSVGGWKKDSTPKTYISKQWKDYLTRKNRDTYAVKSTILQVDADEFENTFTQRRKSSAEYDRIKHENIIQYEFLLPLSKETKLRRALDELFYKDTLLKRIDEAGLENLTKIIKREENELDSQLKDRITKEVSSYFGGYSISHVNGRFRAGALLNIKEAAECLLRNSRYIIDETTALVRFIIPCATSKQNFTADFSSILNALSNTDLSSTEMIDKEVNKIRCLFFFFFVESIVTKILDEDEIWLIETGRGTQRLYRWQKKS